MFERRIVRRAVADAVIRSGESLFAAGVGGEAPRCSRVDGASKKTV